MVANFTYLLTFQCNFVYITFLYNFAYITFLYNFVYITFLYNCVNITFLYNLVKITFLHNFLNITFLHIFLYTALLKILCIGLVSREFANGQGDLDSIPGRVIPKTLKRVLDTSLLNTQHYKVRIKR